MKLSRLLLQAPLTVLLFSLAWLLEKLVGDMLSVWAAIIFVAPVFEELARYLLTDLLELEYQHEGAFHGLVAGFAETVILFVSLGLTPQQLVFRALFSQSLHITLGACLVGGKNALFYNVLIHFWFNYGILIGKAPGMIIASSALMLNLVRIIFSSPEPNVTTD